ncbi:MAG: hypothetical protein HY814_13260 [Candidatus Riflebacteria bacterium]|nr:hypothetical protein [Candidatus Riflebacteria bacterium]
MQLVDAAGIVKASRSFTGRAAKTVRFPSPHPYRSFDSIHAIGRKHAGCAAYPEPDYLLRHALHDAVAGHSGAASWVRGQMR